MERKRKLPARAAARSEQAHKRRSGKGGASTPSHAKSETPVPEPEPEPEPAPVEELPPPLPKSITAGKPLPTVDSPQPEDLPNKDYQSVAESGVLSESLTRSRQKWISESIFEKYWSKPTKKKGVVIEDPDNPPKDSMVKLGQVTITVEPHVFDATMYGVKDPKPPPPPPTERPILQYGPPNGEMPPPPPPKQKPTSTPKATPMPAPAPAPTQPTQPTTPAPSQAPTPPQPQAQPAAPTPAESSNSIPPQPQPVVQQPQAPPPTPPPPAPGAMGATPVAAINVPRPPMASPRGMESVLHSVPPQPAPSRPPITAPLGAVQPPQPSPSPGVTAPTATATTSSTAPVPKPAGAPAAKPNPGTDPIILTLAEKAGEDPHLRDLMKRVAQGDAAKHELARFQAIIDAITAESKKKGQPVGPAAERLLVDGRTVRYFADEVRAILDIVLSSNPKQTSADLRPPEGSDPLVVALVKAALDDAKTRDAVRRIAGNKPLFSDATELKVVLDGLRTKLIKEREAQQKALQPPPAAAAAAPKANGTPNGHPAPSPASTATATPPAAQQPPATQQGLRSKGPPPPPPKPDYSAVVFEFSGGSGDRFLFPKFSVVEYVPTPAGQQVIASFLIVRKGSKAEYPMTDPELDYYQPMTIRLFTPVGRHLENLARVVAPQAEVRMYMDDIMNKMTRAEYILLAMRLPRGDPKEGEAEGGSGNEEKNKEKEVVNGGKQGSAEPMAAQKAGATPLGVLWGTKKQVETPKSRPSYGKTMDVEEQQYQSFVSLISRKEPKEV